MTDEDLKRKYGSEYPAAVHVLGFRMPLVRERRWSRYYYNAEARFGHEISRFMDGTASLSLTELAEQWHSWTSVERREFGHSCGWLADQADFVDMLRFIVVHATQDDLSSVARLVATRLPVEGAFTVLLEALRAMPLGRGANLCQGIALTKHGRAAVALLDRLQCIWAHEQLWHDGSFSNPLAFEATVCIQHLLELGESPNDYAERVRALSNHPCRGNRNTCSGYLGRHYPWLPPLSYDDSPVGQLLQRSQHDKPAHAAEPLRDG